MTTTVVVIVANSHNTQIFMWTENLARGEAMDKRECEQDTPKRVTILWYTQTRYVGHSNQCCDITGGAPLGLSFASRFFWPPCN